MRKQELRQELRVEAFARANGLRKGAADERHGSKPHRPCGLCAGARRQRRNSCRPHQKQDPALCRVLFLRKQELRQELRVEAFARANGLRKGAADERHGRKPRFYIIIYIGQSALSAVSVIG